MITRMALALIVALLSTACETKTVAPPTQALAPPPAGLPAEYARFYGVWSGKWDETWDVTFVIDEISAAGIASGDDYWKEHVPGSWHHQTTLSAIEGDAVTFGVMTITIDPADNRKAVAIGRFEKNTRAASLTKLQVP
jgi:hypothetical protein